MVMGCELRVMALSVNLTAIERASNIKIKNSE